jgi:hypothetical protein
MWHGGCIELGAQLTQETTMKTPKLMPLDAAAIILGAGLLIGVVARVFENARQLAALIGY